MNQPELAARLRLRVGLSLLASLVLPAAAAGPKSNATPGQRRKTVSDRAPERMTYGGREEAMAFADDLATRNDLPAAWVRSVLAEARFIPAVTRLIMPPAAGIAKNWAAYRARFVETQRIQAGLAFARAQAVWLQRAEQRWGVAPEIVLGIIGVETFYGRLMGSFRVLDALATLSFDFPSGRSDRSPFFRDELEHLILWSHSSQVHPSWPKGSFAGAIGLGQFMPSSIHRFGIDFDDDGRIDMVGSAADVIGSIGHYLAAHGWQRDLPTHFEVRAPVDTAARAGLLVPDIRPSFSASQMAAAGAELPAPAQAYDGLLALVELQNGAAAPGFVAGTSNFYALTRYNRSSYYAMAVIELGRAVVGAASS